MSASAERLVPAINSLKFKYLLQAGIDATLLLLPKRRDFVKQFAEDLVLITDGECGSAPYVFDCLWNGRREMGLCDLKVQLYDGDDMAVGNPLN